jgi:nitroimidazol reductase NimA-like FMN-containing flavoprotein (pyridoxamine 5'-phosphate oxidase superfamily)
VWGNLDKNQIEDLLKSELIGRVGCFDGNKVYVVPVTYAYNDGYVYGHTKDGLKIRMMRNNPKVCFEIDWMRDLSNWKSVIAYGTFEELKGDDANNGLEILMKSITANINEKSSSSEALNHNNQGIENFAFQHSFLAPFLHSNNNEISEIVVYRIKVNEITGKYGDDKESAADY